MKGMYCLNIYYLSYNGLIYYLISKETKSQMKLREINPKCLPIKRLI